MIGLDHDLLAAREEQDLARRAQSGDVESRNRLVECNLRLIWSEASKYTDEDVQEYFLAGCYAALEAIKSFRPANARLAPYLKVVTRRAMWNARRPKEEVPLTSDLSTELTVQTDQGAAERLEALTLARLSEAELDPVDTSAVRLHYGLGAQEPLSQRQVADRLGISRARVQQRLARALTRLRASFLAAGQSTWEDVLREIEHD